MNMQIWAHRGASGYAPENTLDAFQLAIEQNVDGIELDIQLTRDREIVVIHDETIDRVSDGYGWVKDLSLKELKHFCFNKRYPQYVKSSIPTLAEVYDLLKNTNLTINVELKTGRFFYEGIEEKVLDLTMKKGMEERVIYSSFNHHTISRIKKMDEKVKTGFLVTDGILELPQYVKKWGVNALHPAMVHLQYPNLVNTCKALGLAIHVWNVKDIDIQECAQKGVDAVITNYPDRTRMLLEKKKNDKR